MIATVKAARIAIYINTGYKTLAQVKAETGCDYIINGGLFEGKNACCQLKADGVSYANDGYNYWGFSWNDVSDFRMARLPDDKQNYIGCVDLLRNGQTGDMLVNPQIGGARQRTAIGKDKEGRVVLYCTQSAKTPTQVRDEMKTAGCLDAVMLDGGLSSQCDFDGDKLIAARVVHNFICVWSTANNKVLKLGSKGEDVKKLQQDLNVLGYGLKEDGDFGNKTDIAVRHFQNYYSLTIDGIAGSKTFERLEKAVAWAQSDDSVLRKAMACVGLSEPSGDDAIIKEYNSIAGASLSLNASWCMMFAVVMQHRAGREPILTPSCTVAMNYYKAKGKWLTSGAAGNLVFFDWDGSGDADHVGIVAEVSGSTVYVIEGNSSGSGYDAVRCKTYGVTDTRIKGYADVSEEEKPRTAYEYAVDMGIILNERETDKMTVGMFCEIMKRAGII